MYNDTAASVPSPLNRYAHAPPQPTNAATERVLELDDLSGRVANLHVELCEVVGRMIRHLDTLLLPETGIASALPQTSSKEGLAPGMARVFGLRAQLSALDEQMTRLRQQLTRMESL